MLYQKYFFRKTSSHSPYRKSLLYSSIMQVGRIFPINNPVVDLSLFMTFKRAQLYRSRNTVSIVDAQRQFPGVPGWESRCTWWHLYRNH